MGREDLGAAEWERLGPSSRSVPGVWQVAGPRQVIDGILYRGRTGMQ